MSQTFLEIATLILTCLMVVVAVRSKTWNEEEKKITGYGIATIIIAVVMLATGYLATTKKWESERDLKEIAYQDLTGAINHVKMELLGWQVNYVNDLPSNSDRVIDYCDRALRTVALHKEYLYPELKNSIDLLSMNCAELKNYGVDVDGNRNSIRIMKSVNENICLYWTDDIHCPE